ncbi:MAG: hypothetical protein AAGU32_18230, partial [Bacillota bacterium]
MIVKVFVSRHVHSNNLLHMCQATGTADKRANIYHQKAIIPAAFMFTKKTCLTFKNALTRWLQFDNIF